MNLPWASIEASLDLRFLRRCLVLACLGAVFLLALELVSGAFKETRPNPRAADLQRGSESSAGVLEEQTIYERVFQNSRIFGFEKPKASLPVIQSSISELAKDYRLQGVMLMGEPEAIIKNMKTSQTLFVKTGDSLGELNIKSIQEGKILLEYLGEEKVLSIDG